MAHAQVATSCAGRILSLTCGPVTLVSLLVTLLSTCLGLLWMRSAGCFSPVSTCLFASSLLRHSWPNDFIKLCRALGRFGCTVFITYVTLSIFGSSQKWDSGVSVLLKFCCGRCGWLPSTSSVCMSPGRCSSGPGGPGRRLAALELGGSIRTHASVYTPGGRASRFSPYADLSLS